MLRVDSPGQEARDTCLKRIPSSSGQAEGCSQLEATPPPLRVQAVHSACHSCGPPSVDSLDFRPPDLSSVPPTCLPCWAPSEAALPALTSFSWRGKTGTCRYARTVAAPGQTQGPVAPGHPGGSNAGHSSALAGGREG